MIVGSDPLFKNKIESQTHAARLKRKMRHPGPGNQQRATQSQKVWMPVAPRPCLHFNALIRTVHYDEHE